MNHPVDFRVVLVSAAAILLLALRLLRFDQSPSAPNAESRQPEAVAPVPSAESTPEPDGKPVADAGATFAPRMQGNYGVSVIASNGQYRANAVRVAVPNAFHDLQYLPGTDPAAVKYLEDARAAEEKLTMDYGPANADMSSLPPPGANQAKRVAVTVNNN